MTMLTLGMSMLEISSWDWLAWGRLGIKNRISDMTDWERPEAQIPKNYPIMAPFG